jgi:hypothetical protein
MKAFPHTRYVYDSEKIEVSELQAPGMDLRDYFAAQAMPFIAEGLKQIWFADQSFEEFCNTEMTIIADRSYAMADEMMKARERK